MSAKRDEAKDTAQRRSPMAKQSLLVFHINDSTDDQVLFQAACKKAGIPLEWQVADSAKRAMAYLESLVLLSRTQTVHWPDLVVLDIVMPGGSGFEVLEYIRRTPELQPLPVVILTEMASNERLERAYVLGVNSFHEKPLGFRDMVDLVINLYEVWSSARRPVL